VLKVTVIAAPQLLGHPRLLGLALLALGGAPHSAGAAVRPRDGPGPP
jgi:hypothetical protein